jgi:mRNA-degrading endonuclease RelE of RelBE toxin-antitoxin system
LAEVEYSIDAALSKELSKIKKKDLTRYRIIMKQIEKVLINPEVGKPLRSSLFGLRRLHIVDHLFCLILTIRIPTKLIS